MSRDIDWQDYSQGDILRAFLSAAHIRGARLAVWRETVRDSLFVLLSFQAAQGRVLSNALPAGFVYNPFKASGSRCFFLPADLLYEFRGNRLVAAQARQNTTAAAFFAALRESLSAPARAVYYSTPLQCVADESRAAFSALVRQALTQIRRGALQKVVPARSHTIDLPDTFDVIEVFLKLTRLPEQFVSLLSSPEEGTWLGCSPELLLALNDAAIQTVSLAGTKPKEQAWTEKEYQEQEWVNTFIRAILHESGLSRVEETPLDNMHIGDFKHLKTLFRIDLGARRNQLEIFADLLARLHPTPALCGTPQQAARDFIRRHENFQRGLYAGYLGPYHIQARQIRLYANIRCMQLFSRRARLFLGAGVTAASDPEAEWRETCLKSRTLLDVL